MEVTLLRVLRCEWKLSYIKRRDEKPCRKVKHRTRSGTSWKFGVPELRTGDFACLSLFPGNLKGKEWEQDDKWLHILLEASLPVLVSLRIFVIWLKGVGLSCQSDTWRRTTSQMCPRPAHITALCFLAAPAHSHSEAWHGSGFLWWAPLYLFDCSRWSSSYTEPPTARGWTSWGKIFWGGGKKDTGQEYLSCRKMCPCQKSTELYHQCQYNVSY